ncbi:DsbC family protein [Methylotenera sp. L2L1]|uniref:DsbC family protein n=1 Tax=Methylotenera sp. L2L1 TaxID=1502770 RepID=UPI00055C3EFB|nr:DsbC family protein [Methylotenera sp. L2L1]
MTFSKKALASLLSVGLLFGGSSLLANASEADDINAIKMNLEKRTPPLNAKSIKLSPLAGVYEVYANGNIFYVDKTVSYVMVGGSLVEDATKRNLTTERLQELTTIKFDSLPFKNAIEIKKGNGQYKFAVFSDPDCPFCKTLEQGLEKMGISDYTAYIFLFPLKELHPDAVAKSESIWCAKDKNEAWSNWMVKGIAPVKANCENPLAANEKLADDLGVAGTPTIYMNNGKQTQAPQELVAAIKESK